MIGTVRPEIDSYAAHFESLGKELQSVEPGWLTELRNQAWLYFEERGFPTTRDEAWKYTDVKPLAETPFRLADASEVAPRHGDFDAVQFAKVCAHRAVFVNGLFRPELSDLEGLPSGVRVRNLAAAIADNPDRIRTELAKQVSFDHQVFSALNLAFLRDGASVEVEAGVIAEAPIQLLFLNVTGAHPHMSHPRILISAAENSQVTVVETHVAVDEGTYLSNPVTEIVARDGAVVDHYKLQKESGKAFHVATVQTYQERGASVQTLTVSLAGLIIRNETNAKLDGEGGWAELNGLFLVSQNHHVDNFTRLEHAQPRCDSREVYKGLLSGKARGVFRGRIVVAKGAQKTDSKQTNNNLLLSDDALVNTKPQLEIYADDVKCTHGATVGQLDKNGIFYLRSRGIDAEVARSILIYAFAAEIVTKVKVEALRDQLNEYLFEWLPRGKAVRQAV